MSTFADEYLKRRKAAAGNGNTGAPVQNTVPTGTESMDEAEFAAEYLAKREKTLQPERYEAKQRRQNLEYLDELDKEFDQQWYDYNNVVSNGGIAGATPMQNERAQIMFENTMQARKDTLAKVTEKDRYEWAGIKLAENALKDKDFAAYAKKGAAVENPKMTDVMTSGGLFGSSKKPVNKVMYTLQNWDAYEKLKFSNNNPVLGTVDAGAYGLYDLAPHMTADEVNIYNYYLAKDMEDGTSKADEYLRFMEETLNARKGAAHAGELQGKTALELGYAAVAGLDQFVQGVKNVGSMFSWDSQSNYVPTSSAQVAGSIIREDLKDDSIKYYNPQTGKWENHTVAGNSLGQMAYDTIQTSSNMAPSILLSTAVGIVNPAAGAAVGGVLLGASAAGNAYQQKIQAGYTQSQARSYGALVGISEAVLEATLGAVGGAAGKGMKDILGKVSQTGIQKIDDVLARVAKTAGGKIATKALGEGAEEAIQSILEPAFAHVVAGEEFTVDMEETLYSALLGAVMGAGFGSASPNTYQGNIPGISANEKTQLKTVLDERIKSREESLGRKLTAAEKLDIEIAVRNEIITQRGNEAAAPVQGTAPSGAAPSAQQQAVSQPQQDAAATVPGQQNVSAPAQKPSGLGIVQELLEAAKPDPIFDALKSYRDSGIVSNTKAEAILANPEALQQLTQQTGIPIEGTKSQQRAAVKEAVAKIDKPTVDNTAAATYDNTTNQGGVNYEREQGSVYSRGVRRNAESNSSGEVIEGERNRSLYAGDGSQSREVSGRNQATVYPSDIGRGIKPEAQEALRGTTVADSNGNPIAVFHATDNVEFETFSKGDTGFHFGNKNQAETHRKKRGYTDGRIIRAYLDIKNPIRAENDIMAWNPNGTALYLWSKGILTDSERAQVDALWKPGDKYESPSAVRLREILESKGYDGIVYPNDFEGDGDSYIVFKDSQIFRDGEERFSSTATPSESVGAAPAGFGEDTYEEVQSKVISNSYANATDESMRRSGEEALKNDPDIGTYYRSKEATSVRNAESRTQTKEQVEYEYRYLMENGINSAEDLDTSMRVRDALFEAGDKRFQDMVRLQRQTGTKSGQITQAFAKYSRMSAASVAAEVVDSLDQLTQNNVPKKFWRKGGFDQFKEKTLSSAMDIAKQIGSVEDGDVDGMKDIIRSLAKFRKTTAWFGTSSNLTKTAEAAMNSLTFEEAKALANAQLSTLPNDFKKRPAGQVVKTIRIHNMLSSLTTILRNLGGNTAIGMVDAVSDSTVGRAFDALVSKATGKRTVGNDVKYAKEYFTKAWDATKMAALCAELDIPMESESRFSTGSTRTYSPQGNPVMRFLSAYEKYMKYALEVTDRFYAGGTNATVDKSLAALGEKANLSAEEQKAVSELAGQRRTFKDERMATRGAKKIRQGLNEFGGENLGLGDLTMPFASIGSTLAHTAADYTVGAVTGTAQILQLISDVKRGKYVDGVKTVRSKSGGTRQITLAEAQRAAVTNAARGTTGIALVATFAALAACGVLKVSNDDDPDKRALDQSQNLSGAQLNVDAALRGIIGKDASWKDNDLVISLDFLEPFNAQMYLGWLVSQDDSVADMVKNYPKNAIVSVASSIADMPAMQGLQEAQDILSSLTQVGEETDLAEWGKDAAGTLLGSTASSFIPSWMRQTAQVIDPYYRDTTGENALDSAWNQFAASVPFLSQSLPKKHSGLGQEQRRYDDLASGIFNTFVNPGDADRLNLSDVASYLDELSERTGDESIYPSYRAPGSIGSGDGKIVISGKDMTEKYQKTYGENANRLYGDLIASSDFEAMDDESKTKILNTAKSYASELAKNKIGAGANIPKYISERPSGMSETEAIIRHFAYGSSQKYASLPVEKATFVDELLASLTPPPGKKEPTTSQKITAITGADNELTERQQAAVLKETLSDPAYEKYLAILKKGYSNDEYAISYEIYTREKAIGGKGTKDRTIEMFQKRFNLSESAATALYEIYNPK